MTDTDKYLGVKLISGKQDPYLIPRSSCVIWKGVSREKSLYMKIHQLYQNKNPDKNANHDSLPTGGI